MTSRGRMLVNLAVQKYEVETAKLRHVEEVMMECENISLIESAVTPITAVVLNEPEEAAALVNECDTPLQYTVLESASYSFNGCEKSVLDKSSVLESIPDIPPSETNKLQISSLTENEYNTLALNEFSSIDSSNGIDFDSDDSLIDKNYVPENVTDTSLQSSYADDNDFKSDNDESGRVEKQTSSLTKKGTIRKRKIVKKSVEERRMEKTEALKKNHRVKPPCDHCRLKCNENFNEEERIYINKDYWELSWSEKRMFVLGNTTRHDTKQHRKTEKLPQRQKKNTFKYFLSKNGNKIQVCKVFFISTLGYSKNNDRIIQDCLCKDNYKKNTPRRDQRGKHRKTAPVDKEVIRSHINNVFGPTISHYRREHAPKKLYLPSDLTIRGMYKDFQEMHAGLDCSYELYRKVVSKDLNISFAKLGTEECETCEYFTLHERGHSKENINPECNVCTKWQEHIKRAEDGRRRYREDAEKTTEDEEGTVYFSADMEKVIMIPRIDMFKRVIFCPRLIVFNESSVPLGNKQKSLKPIAVLWHEAISGRKKEDLIRAFFKFLIAVRDAEKVVLWLDNCAGQNKNWSLFTFLVYVINSNFISATSITLNYLEPGHTFLSADSFHHQVEQSLKRRPKVYDFSDFKTAVQESNSRKVEVLEMAINDFYEWIDHSSLHKINKTTPRPYMKDIVSITATRGMKVLQYKTSFYSQDVHELNFLKAKEMKHIPQPIRKTALRGITKNRKNAILGKLSELMPENRLNFWKSIAVNDQISDSEDVSE